MSQAQAVRRHRSALQGNNNTGLEAKYKTKRTKMKQHLMLKKHKRSSNKEIQNVQKENKQQQGSRINYKQQITSSTGTKPPN
jgi:hypothetical protein